MTQELTPFFIPMPPSGREPDASRLLRLQEAMKYAKWGKTYEEIAELCGYSDANAVKQAISAQLKKDIPTDTEELRTLHGQALKILQAEAFEAFFDRDNTARWYVLDRILPLMEQYAALYGLNKQKEDIDNLKVVVVRQLPSDYLGGIEPPKAIEAEKDPETQLLEAIKQALAENTGNNEEG